MDKTLIVLIGLPKSGKSYWSNNQPYPVVEMDKVRLDFYGKRFLKEYESEAKDHAKNKIISLFSYTTINTVILDDCNITKSDRDFWLSDYWITKYHLIDTPKEVCINRSYEREEDEGLVPIIEKMNEEFENIKSKYKYVIGE